MKQQKINEALVELHTIRDWLRWAVSCFQEAKLYFGHGTDNAWDEAIALILFGLHLPQDINPQIMDAKLTISERQRLVDIMRERIELRTPLPYITRNAIFAGLPFYVDQRVIIPRSPIAELIDKQFSPWLEEGRVKNILDLCTGSACIAIACAHAFPMALIDAVDISQDALDVAKINVDRYQLQPQIKVLQSDLFNDVPDKTYDLIVSNPPYVNLQEYETLPREYHFEPHLSLAAGKDGLDITDKILLRANHYLADNGILVVEVGSSAAALEEKYPHIPFLWVDFEHGGEGVFILTKQQLQ